MTYLLRVLPIAALLLVAPTLAQAQEPTNSAPAKLNGPTTPQNGPNTGTDPANMGNTGWTGGRADGNREGSKETSADQPVMATGEDLKGPPAQFPPNKTPE